MAVRRLQMSDLFAPLHRKEARLRLILSALSTVEREALYRFYSLREEDSVISQDLEFVESEFRELRTRVRTKFLLSDQAQ